MKRFILLLTLLLSVGVYSQDTLTISQKSSLPKEAEEKKVLQVKPEYPGGIPEFHKFIMGKFKQPYKIGHATTVKVYASFVVEKDGSMSNFKILRDPGYGLGDETLRVLKLCKIKWKPGIIDGLPVRASYNLPLTINIKN